MRLSWTFSLISLLSGCISLGGFQGPEVLPKGKTEVGVGMVAGDMLGDDGGGALGLMELYGRYGLAPRLEIGGRTTGFWAAGEGALGAIMIEGKYQLLTQRPLVAAGMGLSYFGLRAGEGQFVTLGFYPALWLGSPHFYTGMRVILIAAGSSIDDEVGTASLAGFVLGGTVGNSVRLRPELIVYIPLTGSDRHPLLLGGLGLSFRWGGDKSHGL
jgi:hypothetical protein